MNAQRNLTLLIWPVVLVVAGLLLLLHNYLLLEFNVLQLWPLLLVALGIQTILRGDLGFSWETRSFGITRGSVESAVLRANAGELDVTVHVLEREGRLIAGQYTARSRPDLVVEGTHATLTMLRERTWFFSLGDWELTLAGNLPWDVLLSTHLGEINADLRGVIIGQAHIASGIGDIHLIAPDNPAGPVNIRSTFGNIHLIVPENMEAAITVEGSPLFNTRVEGARWREVERNVYTTHRYNEAVEPLEITVRGTFGDLVVE